MTLYRVEFSKDWLMGRWGYTDRLFSSLKGRETEPSRLENAWLVNFRGNASDLGDLLTDSLNIRRGDFRRFGTIFEITILSEPHGPEPRRPARHPLDAAPPPWERSDSGRHR